MIHPSPAVQMFVATKPPFQAQMRVLRPSQAVVEFRKIMTVWRHRRGAICKGSPLTEQCIY